MILRWIALPKRVFKSPSSLWSATGLKFYINWRQIAITAHEDVKSVSHVRNVGIMAHIDAGKTTTTERMLYVAGRTSAMGDVDSGDTVTDYLPQERERGITITSAAVSFTWDGHHINLIDTPGHVDFTLEVERSLRVVEGAVAVLDASAGVEAQTLSVWRQATKYHIPTIVYLNKMDKAAANMEMCLRSIKEKLGILAIPLQIPIFNEGRDRLAGIIDLVHMERWTWDHDSSKSISYQICPVCPDGTVTEAREAMLSKLADVDGSFGERLLSSDLSKITPAEISVAVRRATLSRAAVPVLCGSSLKNKGVQPLLNAICSYLPHPLERPAGSVTFYEPNLCALAFKVIHDQYHGALTLLRIYSGLLKAKTAIHNVNQGLNELIQRVYFPFAGDMVEVAQAGPGSIVAVMGLKETITGDTIVGSLESAKHAAGSAHKYEASHSGEKREILFSSSDRLILAGIETPDPVFSCTIEPPSTRLINKFERALVELQREDPSVRIVDDAESQRRILNGMGELHIEVIKYRLQNEYGLDVFLGPLFVNYKEGIRKAGTFTATIDEVLQDRRQFVTMTLSVTPRGTGFAFKKLRLAATRGSDNIVGHLLPNVRDAIEEGVKTGLQSGPLGGYPVIGVDVTLEHLEKRGASSTVVTACAIQAVHSAMRIANAVLMEPVGLLDLMVEQSHSHAVLSDLAQRKADILGVDLILTEGTYADSIAREHIRANVPLSMMADFSSTIRKLTSGLGSYHLEPCGYRIMAEHEQRLVMEKL